MPLAPGARNANGSVVAVRHLVKLAARQTNARLVRRGFSPIGEQSPVDSQSRCYNPLYREFASRYLPATQPHAPPPVRMANELPNCPRECLGIPDRHKKTILAVAHNLPTARDICSDQGTAYRGGLEQHFR